MPYIQQSLRDKVDAQVEDLIANIASRQGHLGLLNYVCTRLILGTLKRKFTNLDYEQLVSINGLLETMKLEMNSRLTCPYEFNKQWVNGDVIEYALYAAERSPMIKEQYEG